MTPETIIALLRYVRPEFVNVMNEQSTESPFEGLYREVPVTDGILNFGAFSRFMRFEEFDGELKPIGLDAVALTKNLQLFKAGLEISRDVLNDLQSIIASGDLVPSIVNAGSDAISQRDELMLGELEDNATDITGSALFGTSKAIPNARAGVTLTNAISGEPAAPTPDELRDTMGSVRETFYGMKSANGRDYHRRSLIQNTPIIGLFPDSMIENAMKAFGEDLVVSASTGAGSNVYKGACQPRVVSAAADNVAYFALQRQTTPQMILGYDPKRRAIPFESNAGDMGGTADRVSRELQIHETVLISTGMRETALRGNPWGWVRVTFDG